MDLSEDTRVVKEEFDAISTPTQVFIAVLCALSLLIGFLLGGAIGYGAAEDENDDGNAAAAVVVVAQR